MDNENDNVIVNDKGNHSQIGNANVAAPDNAPEEAAAPGYVDPVDDSAKNDISEDGSDGEEPGSADGKKAGSLKNKNLIITAVVLVLVIAAAVVTLIVVRNTSGKVPDETEPAGFEDGTLDYEEVEIGTVIETHTSFKNIVVGTTVVEEGGTTAVQEVTSKITETVTEVKPVMSSVPVSRPAQTTKAQSGNTENTTSRKPAVTTEEPTFRGSSAQIDAFIGGHFYIDASMTDETGAAQTVSMAKDGDNLLVGMNSEGINAKFMYADGMMYMVSPEKKTYVPLNDLLTEMMGMDIDEFKEEFAQIDFSDMNLKLDGKSSATVNGVKYTVYDYKSDEGEHLKGYLDSGNNLKRIEISDGSGAESTVLVVNEFAYEDLASYFTLDGYTQSSILDFAAEFGITDE